MIAVLGHVTAQLDSETTQTAVKQQYWRMNTKWSQQKNNISATLLVFIDF